MKRLCGTVLGMEATLVALCIVPWALYAGSALQFAVIAAGVVLPVMYVLGVIFAALWFGGIWLARKWESAEAAAR